MNKHERLAELDAILSAFEDAGRPLPAALAREHDELVAELEEEDAQ